MRVNTFQPGFYNQPTDRQRLTIHSAATINNRPRRKQLTAAPLAHSYSFVARCDCSAVQRAPPLATPLQLDNRRNAPRHILYCNDTAFGVKQLGHPAQIGFDGEPFVAYLPDGSAFSRWPSTARPSALAADHPRLHPAGMPLAPAGAAQLQRRMQTHDGRIEEHGTPAAPAGARI